MKVSIVIPCYNVAEYIDDALTSALAQTYPDIEIICVDNGSTDSTLDYLKGYETRGEIILMKQPVKGAPAARNMGWRTASGSWIQFLDGDDVILPQKIAQQIALIADNPKADFVASAATKTNLDTGESTQWLVHENVWHGLMQNQLGITTANLFCRKALEQIDGWDEALKSSQEYDLMFRMMRAGGTVVVDKNPENSIIRSRSVGSISSADVQGNKHRFMHLVSRIALHLRENEPAVYQALGQDYFQRMFLRIRLNTIDGMRDSSYFFKSILPNGFKPDVHDYTPAWFRWTMKSFGFPMADRLSRIKRMFRS